MAQHKMSWLVLKVTFFIVPAGVRLTGHFKMAAVDLPPSRGDWTLPLMCDVTKTGWVSNKELVMA